jgi:hypothetical protein
MKKTQTAQLRESSSNYDVFRAVVGNIKETVSRQSVTAYTIAVLDMIRAVRDYGCEDPRTLELLARYKPGFETLKGHEAVDGIDFLEEVKKRFVDNREPGLLEATLAASSEPKYLTSGTRKPARASGRQARTKPENGETLNPNISYDAKLGERFSLRELLSKSGLNAPQRIAAPSYITAMLDKDSVLKAHAHIKCRGYNYDNTREVVDRINQMLSSREFAQYAGGKPSGKSAERKPEMGHEGESHGSESAGDKRKREYMTQKDIVCEIWTGKDYLALAASRHISKLLKAGDKALLGCFKSHGSFYEVVAGREAAAKTLVAERLKGFMPEDKKKLKIIGATLTAKTEKPVSPPLSSAKPAPAFSTPVKITEVRPLTPAPVSSPETKPANPLEPSEVKPLSGPERLGIEDIAAGKGISPQFLTENARILGAATINHGFATYDADNINRVLEKWTSQEGKDWRVDHPDYRVEVMRIISTRKARK